MHRLALLLLVPGFLLSSGSIVRAGDGLDDPSAVARAKAVAALDALQGDDRTAALRGALENSHKDVRIRAARALSATEDHRALRALAHHALRDEEPAVRVLALAAMRRSPVDELARLFTPSLGAREPAVRMRAAEALGALGDASATGALVVYMTRAGGSPQGVYLSQTTQIGFVQDFDVEVA
jgi:HEAT repeat protein